MSAGRGQGGLRVTEEREEAEAGRPGANELTPNPRMDQTHRSTPRMQAR